MDKATVNDFNCDCFPGYTDAICQTDIDDCAGINCSGNGRCVDMVNIFLCDCEPGYTGADCETNIDDCVNRNCSGNGVCVDGVNSFSCECVSGFTGETCSVETHLHVSSHYTSLSQQLVEENDTFDIVIIISFIVIQCCIRLSSC